MDTKKLLEVDKKHHWHPYTKFSALENGDIPIIERAEGIYLYDTEGNRYLDAISTWWANDLGHSRKDLVEEIQNQVNNLQHSITGNMSNIPVIKLSEKLANLFEDNRRHVLFASDGASAVEASLKISLQYWHNLGKPEKFKFATIKNGYHGDTLGAVSVGFVDGFHKPFERFVNPAFRADNPLCAKCDFGKNEESCAAECFESMEEIFADHGDELAAVILEPLCQGSAGMRIYSPKYLVKLEAYCRKHNVLLIVDEIATGYGRTGAMFAFEHAGIDPDIVCVAKGLSTGYLPISAAIVKDRIYETFSDSPKDHTFYHGHTHAGNPVVCSLALKVLEIYERENIVEKAALKGDLLESEFQKFRELEAVDNIRCLGMIAVVDLKEDIKKDGLTAPEYVKCELLNRGIMIRPLGTAVYLMLPLITEDEIIRETVSILYEAVKSI